MSTPMAHPGFFPAAADPATHMASVPYARTLGFVWERGDADGACIRMPLVPANSRDDGQSLDPLATLGLLDHVCSASVYLALPAPRLIATIDLRCEFAGAPDPGAGLLCTARTQHIDDAFAIVRATAVCTRSGRTVAYASSAYAIGSHPGMQDKPEGTQPRDVQGLPPEPGDMKSFARMLGLQQTTCGLQLPFRHRLIGALSLPAVHGGATGAALVSAALAHARQEVDSEASWRPLTVSIHYLRAVEAVATRLSPALRKRSRRSCVVSVSALQGDPAREATHAECLLANN